MVSTLPVFLTGASYLQLKDDLGLTPATLGALTAVFFLTASLMSAPLGRLVERIGWRTAMRINCIVSASVLLAIAFLGTSIWLVGSFLAAGGMVYGFANPSANLSLAEGAPTARRGLVFGLKHAGIPASTLFAGAAVPVLVLTIGWRPTFALSALLAPVLWILISTDAKRSRAPVAPPAPAPTTGQLKSRHLVVLAIGSACATWAAVSLGTFLVAGSTDAALSESQAGLLLFVGSATSITARIIAGLIADRRSSRGFAGVSLMMLIGASTFVLISDAAGIGFAAAVVLAFAFGWGWPGLMTYAVVQTDPGSAASSSAVTQAGIFLGAGLGPIALGWIVDKWSFQVGWLSIGVFLAIASLIVAAVAVRTRRPIALASQEA